MITLSTSSVPIFKRPTVQPSSTEEGAGVAIIMMFPFQRVPRFGTSRFTGLLLDEDTEREFMEFYLQP